MTPPPPPGIHLAETPDGFEVSTSFRHPLFTTHAVLVAAVATTVGLGLDAFACSALFHARTEGWGKPVCFGLVGLLITCIGLCACVGAFIHLFGTWTFRLAGDEAMCGMRFFGRKNGKWAHAFRWSEVREFTVTMQDGNPPYEEFAFVMQSGEHIACLDSMRGKKLAFLTEFFRRKVAKEAAKHGEPPTP